MSAPEIRKELHQFIDNVDEQELLELRDRIIANNNEDFFTEEFIKELDRRHDEMITGKVINAHWEVAKQKMIEERVKEQLEF